MPSKNLEVAVDSLHGALKSAQGLDAETHRKLVEAIREIMAERDAATHEATRHGLASQLRDAVKHFEQEHADLVAAVGRVADALGSAGL